MATIKYANGFKYYFDVEFVIPAILGYEKVTVTDVLPQGFGVDLTTLELLVTSSDGSEITPTNVDITTDSTTKEQTLTLVIEDPRVINAGADDRNVKVSFAAYVNENLTDGNVENIAYVWGDDAAKLDMPVRFDAVRTGLTVVTNTTRTKNVATSSPAPAPDTLSIIATFNGMDTHEIPGETNYVIKVTLAQELGSFGAAYADELYGIKAYLLTDVPTEVTSAILNVAPTMRSDNNPAAREITIAHREEFRNHQVYIVVPVYLAEEINPMLTNPTLIHSDITAKFMHLTADTIHTTTITADQSISIGTKIIR